MGSLLDILLAVIAGRDCFYYVLDDLPENTYSIISKSTTLAPIIHPGK
jgi:hypothetical protein